MSEQTQFDNHIAIIGLAGRFPEAENIQAFWQNLVSGVDSIAKLDTEHSDANDAQKRSTVYARGVLQNIDLFDAAFFGISPREAELLDPQHRFFLECAWEAIENAGYNVEAYDGVASLYVGCHMNNYAAAAQAHSAAEQFLTIISNVAECLPTRVSYKFNLRGESLTVQTACSSSLVAVHLACQSLLSGSSDMALAGGATIAINQDGSYEYQEGMIYSPDGRCRAFDHRAKGTVEGDGVGVVVLKRLEDAIRDHDYIYAVIRGSAINNDGQAKVGYTAPSVEGQAEVIATALAVADVDAETISYVEAHGTGTPLGDPIEITALTRAFRLHTDRAGYCAVGSVKTNIGHLVHAAGIAGLIKSTLALHHRVLPPSLHFESPNPDIDFAGSPFYVNSSLADWHSPHGPRRAGVSSFGIGGTNAHVILEEAPRRELSQDRREPVLITLSARTSSALEMQKQALKAHCETHLDQRLVDVAYVLSTGRKHFQHRWATVVDSREALIERLGSDAPDEACFQGIAESSQDQEPGIDLTGHALRSRSTLLELAAQWVQGTAIDWAALYPDETCYRVPLPTYPFERRSFWLQPSDKAPERSSSTERTVEPQEPLTRAAVNDWFYTPSWKRTRLPIPYQPGDLATMTSPWLLFVTHSPFCDQLVAAFEHEKLPVIKVYPGATFRQLTGDCYEIDRNNFAHYQTLAEQALSADVPCNLVYAWGYNDPAVAEAATSLGMIGEILGARTTATRCWAVTRDLHLANAGTSAPATASVMLLGMCRVLPHQYAGLSCRIVDFGSAETTADLIETQVERLLSEIVDPSDDLVVAYRGRYRLTETQEQTQLPATVRSYHLRRYGVYLLLGGLTPIGLALADYLAREKQAHLILLDTATLPSRHGWSAWIAEHGPDDPTSRHIVAVQALEQHGSEVIIRNWSPGDTAGLATIVAEARRNFGVIDGVISAFATAENRLTTTSSNMIDPIHGRIAECRVLADVLGDEPIDFCLVCSNLPVSNGHVGIIQAATDRAVELFCEHLSHVAGKPWQSVRWDVLRAAPADTEDTSTPGLSPAEAGELLPRLLSAGRRPIVISTIPLARRSELERQDDTRYQARVEQIDEAPAPTDRVASIAMPPASTEAPPQESAGGANTDATAETIFNICKDYLKIDSISREDDFISLGINSLIILDLWDQCDSALNVEVPVARIFGVLTVGQLIDLYAEMLSEQNDDESLAESEFYVYEIDLGDEVATIVISRQEYLENGVPEGALQFRPCTEDALVEINS